MEILLDHITVQNDRSTKILDFHNPEQLKEVIDFAIPDQPLPLDQLLVDCKDTLKYQVKTGKYTLINLKNLRFTPFFLFYTQLHNSILSKGVSRY